MGRGSAGIETSLPRKVKEKRSIGLQARHAPRFGMKDLQTFCRGCCQGGRQAYGIDKTWRGVLQPFNQARIPGDIAARAGQGF